MPFNDERRKGLRASLPIQMFFNLLANAGEYTRGQATVVRRLSDIDAEKLPPPKNETQMLLSRIDQKLSLILSIMADQHDRKVYLNQTTVLDVSEFGVSFGHHEKLAGGTTLEIGLNLPYNKGQLLDIAGRVIRSQPNTPSEENPYRCIIGVEFTDILSSDQNDIVQWIFSRQREEIRRRREQI